MENVINGKNNCILDLKHRLAKYQESIMEEEEEDEDVLE